MTLNSKLTFITLLPELVFKERVDEALWQLHNHRVTELHVIKLILFVHVPRR